VKKLDWRRIDRDELAALLGAVQQLSSSAVGAATVYRIERDGRQQIAIALPDGEAMLVEIAAASPRRRRRVDAGATLASR
jgi:hypothetical protein